MSVMTATRTGTDLPERDQYGTSHEEARRI